MNDDDPQERPLNDGTAAPLQAWLGRARAALAAEHPPPELLPRVQAAVAAAVALHPPAATAPARRGWPRALSWPGAAALASVLAATLLWLAGLPPPTATDAGLRASGFVSLVPLERWPRDTAAAWLVSTELQGERLAALGLPYDPARAGDSLRAELLLQPSGEVLAVRLVD